MDEDNLNRKLNGIYIIILLCFSGLGLLFVYLTDDLYLVDDTRPYTTISPCKKLDKKTIGFFSEKIIMNMTGINYTYSSVWGTGSMLPFISKDSITLGMVLDNKTQICVGDIISYLPENESIEILHQIVGVGEDDKGLYYTAKGYNYKTKDKEKIRREQIKKVVFAVVY